MVKRRAWNGRGLPLIAQQLVNAEGVVIVVLLDDRRRDARAAIVQGDGLTRLSAMDRSPGRRRDPREGGGITEERLNTTSQNRNTISISDL